MMTAAEAEQSIERLRGHLGAVRQEALRFHEGQGWKALGYDSFADCMQDRLGYSKRHSYQLLDAARIENNLSAPWRTEPIPERHLRPLSAIPDPEDQREVWRVANETAPNGKLTGSHVKQTVEAYVKPKPPTPSAAKNWYTMAEWEALPATEQQRLISQPYSHGKTFNQTNDNVEWALWTWNPVTGCRHDCPYCYARDIADRFYPQKFEPSFIPERLSMPANTKQPDLSTITDPVKRLGLQNVFTCSMADLFGKWVPTKWIEAVLAQVRANPQWNFLFLTKFPIRMSEFDYPDNAWLGTTVDRQWAVERAERGFSRLRDSGFGGVTWLSCEPMLEELTFNRLDLFDWLVMGGGSKSTQTPETRPHFDWTVSLYLQARKESTPIYMKTNLGFDNEIRIREYPNL